MENPLSIREALRSDLSQIAELENISFGGDSFSRRQLSYLIDKAKGSFFVVENEKGIIGYISLLERDGSNTLRIYSVTVHPAERGRKIGQRLLEKSFEYAKQKNLDRISLEVRKDNVVAAEMYRKNGFEEFSILKSYYSDGTDAVRMKKTL